MPSEDVQRRFFGAYETIHIPTAPQKARELAEEEASMLYNLGCTNWPTNKAFVYIVEAARNINSGARYNAVAIDLLKMAIAEIESAGK